MRRTAESIIIAVLGAAVICLFILAGERMDKTCQKAAAYDALMKQVSDGAPPDVVLAAAYDKLKPGMTEEEVLKAVDECIGGRMVSSSRTTPPDGKEGEIRLIWRRYGEFKQADHSCEELNVDLSHDEWVETKGFVGVMRHVKPGGIGYVGNYTIDGVQKERLSKQK